MLLNGIPGESIIHQRGLRQSDPLSHILFIIVTDTLNLIVTKAAEASLLQPSLSRSIQHRLSLYADDIVLFLRPIVSDIDLTVNILRIFGEASGLKTNVQKSSVVPIQCSAEVVETAAALSMPLGRLSYQIPWPAFVSKEAHQSAVAAIY